MSKSDCGKGKTEPKFEASSKYPVYPCIPGDWDFKKIQEFFFQRSILIAKSKPNDVITQDPTPKSVRMAFYELSPQLRPILEKDSVRCFLHLFVKKGGMTYDHSITSQTLTYMINFEARRCAKAILEGKVPRLNGNHANPNCINPYGFFPLHEAAERFSVDMIKLLFRHGASANVRTVGDNIIENLLPLHVAVENTCLHKYLEDNLFPYQNHPDYIYKIIHLLCMPEMKIFLDTIKLLAERTDNLVDGIWNYLKDGKIIQSAVLLLAAQAQIRGGCSSISNSNIKRDGFDIIMCCIVRRLVTLRLENKKANARKLLEEERIFMDFMGLLVDIVSQAGEALSAYIQAHSESTYVNAATDIHECNKDLVASIKKIDVETDPINVAVEKRIKVPHMEVLERVSSILKEYGFCPTEGIVDVKNLFPYDCIPSDEELYHKGLMNSTKGVTGTNNLRAAEEEVNAVEKKLRGGWDPTYTRRRFFPYWRSVILARCFMRVCPAYTKMDAGQPFVPTPVPGHKLPMLERAPQLSSNRQSRRLFGTGSSTASSALGCEELRCSWGSSVDSTPIRNHNVSLFGRAPQLTNNHRPPRRLLGTAASITLKVVRNA